MLCPDPASPPALHPAQADLDAMLSANGSLLDGGASLAGCLAGVGHLMPRVQLMRCLQRDPSFLYQASAPPSSPAPCPASRLGRAVRPLRPVGGDASRPRSTSEPSSPSPPPPSLRTISSHPTPTPHSMPAPTCTSRLQFQPLEGQSRGERDAEYLADMYCAG